MRLKCKKCSKKLFELQQSGNNIELICHQCKLLIFTINRTEENSDKKEDIVKEQK